MLTLAAELPTIVLKSLPDRRAGHMPAQIFTHPPVDPDSPQLHMGDASRSALAANLKENPSAFIAMKISPRSCNLRVSQKGLGATLLTVYECANHS